MVRWGHAQGDRDRSERRRSCSARGDRGGPEQPAEARLAGADHPGDRGRLRHRRDHAPGRGVEAQRLALAGAVHERRRRRSAARQDPAGAHPAAAQGGGRGGRDPHAGRGAAGRGDPLDGAGDGRGERAQRRARCSGSGGRTGCGRIRSAASSCRPTRSSPPRSRTSSGCTSIRRPMPWCCRSTRRARSRRSTGPSRACR